jgi:hypothetical protein
VVRTEGAPDEPFDRTARMAWGAARWERPTGQGTLHLELGGGHHDPFGGIEMAGAASYRIESEGFGARVGVERLLVPVWTDLAPETTPFLQRTWAGVIEARATLPAGIKGRAMFLLGRTADRALVPRVPVQELWLRLGLSRDRDLYDFGLLWWRLDWLSHRYGIGADGFLLGRDENPDAKLVDPKYGFRTWAETRFDAFRSELKVVLRAEVEGVGERETEPNVPPGAALDITEIPLVSPAYLTSVATVIVHIGQTFITVRARNLEDIPRQETWVDPASGILAFGPGREFRFALTARIFD